MDWSLDLSPVEPIWDIIERQKRANHDVTTIRAMKRALQVE